MASDSAVLEVEGVWKRYTERGPWVLRGVDLRVEPGEVAVVLGGNGSGKTTLLRIAAGLVHPSRGRVRVSGGDPRRPRVKALLGVVLHHSLLYDSLTVEENLRYYASLYGVEGYDPRSDPVVEALGLTARLGQRAGELSFGWRKRADIARALLHRPRLLLLDEPFTGLDEAGVEELSGIIGEQARRGVAVVATAPKPGDAARLVEEGGSVYRLSGGVLERAQRG